MINLINKYLSSLSKSGNYPSCVHQAFIGTGESATYKFNGNLGCLLIIQSARSGSKVISINYLYDSTHIDKISGTLIDSNYNISSQIVSGGVSVTVSSTSIVLTLTVIGLLL